MIQVFRRSLPVAIGMGLAILGVLNAPKSPSRAEPPADKPSHAGGEAVAQTEADRDPPKLEAFIARRASEAKAFIPDKQPVRWGDFVYYPPGKVSIEYENFRAPSHPSLASIYSRVVKPESIRYVVKFTGEGTTPVAVFSLASPAKEAALFAGRDWKLVPMKSDAKVWQRERERVWCLIESSTLLCFEFGKGLGPAEIESIVTRVDKDLTIDPVVKTLFDAASGCSRASYRRPTHQMHLDEVRFDAGDGKAKCWGYAHYGRSPVDANYEWLYRERNLFDAVHKPNPPALTLDELRNSRRFVQGNLLYWIQSSHFGIP